MIVGDTMTVRQLQWAVVDDLRKTLKDRRFMVPGGGTAAPHIYAQYLPKVDSLEVQENPYTKEPFPYVIVRVDSGGILSQSDPQRVKFLILVGIFDDGEDNQGHSSVLEVIEAIQFHYEQNPILKQYEFADPFHWALQEEESWPFFYGACSVTFNAPAPRTEWSSDLV